MDRSTQLQNPSVGTVYKYHPPAYATDGKAIRGHLISAHDYQGIPVGHIEWGHPTTPYGNAVVVGGAIREQHRNQQVIDALLHGLWGEAINRNFLMLGSPSSVDRTKGKSSYVP